MSSFFLLFPCLRWAFWLNFPLPVPVRNNANYEISKTSMYPYLGDRKFTVLSETLKLVALLKYYIDDITSEGDRK